ncbi:MAG TPA: glutathione S-transferase [Kofleriaceae bacterium]|nr:glutathione S-transferase [Kofleriaceae bacterium]
MTLRLHRHALSGHAHRVELFLSLLGLPCQLVDVDIRAGEHKQPAFLRLNRFGQIPVLEDGDHVVADSNAILVYLALGHDPSGRWYPREPAVAAEVQRWLSVAAGPLVAGPGTARLAKVFGLPVDLPRATAVATQLLGVLDGHLTDRPFVAATHPTIADLALYTYTAHAPEGGIALEPYPHVRAWLGRIEALPGFVPMPRSPS